MLVFFILEPVRLLGACKPGSRARMDSRTGLEGSGCEAKRYNNIDADSDADSDGDGVGGGDGGSDGVLP